MYFVTKFDHPVPFIEEMIVEILSMTDQIVTVACDKAIINESDIQVALDIGMESSNIFYTLLVLFDQG